MTTSAYVKILRERLSNSIALPFRDILTLNMMQQTLNELNIKYRKRLYDPIITLWTFIWQVLDPDKSCSNAVSHILSFLADNYDDSGADSGVTDVSSWLMVHHFLCMTQWKTRKNLLNLKTNMITLAFLSLEL
jgi:hypothetical protein